MSSNLAMYAPVEQAILADYFRLPAPPETEDLDLWEPDPQNPGAIQLEPDAWSSQDLFKATENAVARIALARVQGALPQFAVCTSDKIEFARDIRQAPRRQVEVLSRHLFTIDWTMTAPGANWPEAYYLTWLPGVERWVVTASNDSPEVRGYCDTTLGHFGAEEDPLEGAGRVIGGYWCDLMTEYDQQHWEVFFNAGMVDRVTALSWAAEVWKPPELDEYEDEEEAV
jgi:hypothetical protein